MSLDMAYNFAANAGQRHHADVAELADALASGASGGNPVEVQILSSALTRATRKKP